MSTYRSPLSRLVLVLVVAVVGTALGQEPARSPAEPALAFPAATPESQGLSSTALKELAGVVAGFVRDEKIVGAEVLVIKNRRAVLHETFGLRDKEKNQPFQRDTICCVRSMTKPIAGVAAQMLIDEGKLGIDDPVAKYFPAFDNDKSRTITIRQVLTHTGGLPLSSLLKVGLQGVKGVRDVADLTGTNGPQFPPGTRLNYSDDGADTAGALVAQVSGMPLEQFVQERLVDPLGMRDTVPVVTKGDRRIGRFACAYGGTTGNWNQFADPNREPLFPYFLASQGLYSTPRDYAKFLALLMDRGKAGGKQLLSTAAVDRILTPGPLSERFIPTGFDGYRMHYGQLLQLYLDQAGKLAAFGHGGSDGTLSYCWPDRDLMVFYFTQSRNNLTYIDFEEALERLLLKPEGTKSASEAVTAETVAPYVGLYWNAAGKRPFAVHFENNRLVVEFPWENRYDLKPDKPDRWVFRLRPSAAVRFQRDDAGKVSDLILEQPNRGPASFPRLQRDDGLPTVEELVKKRRELLKSDQLAGLGTVRLKGTVERATPAAKGTYSALAQGTRRYRAELVLGTYDEKVAVDGEKVWTARRGQPAKEESGPIAEQARLDHPALILADWRDFYQDVQVLKRIEVSGKPAYVVWCVPAHARPRTHVVDAETGRTLTAEFVEQVPGVGNVGLRVLYEDYRDLGGVPWPHRITYRYASPALGRIVMQCEAVETGVTAPADAFSLPASR